jgi:hypothetical protein
MPLVAALPMRVAVALLLVLACTDATEVQSFFKLAFAHVINSPERTKYLVNQLRPAYNQLCSSVEDCDTALARQFLGHYLEVRLNMSRLERLRQVLVRLGTPPGNAGNGRR